MNVSAEIAARVDAYKRRFLGKRRAERWLWAGGRLWATATRPFVGNPRARIDRILVIERILRIGDTLVARPALALLKARFPEARLAVVCAPALAELCGADRLVDATIVAEEGRDGFRRAAAAARAFGARRAYVLVTDRVSPWLARAAGCREIVGYDYAGRGAALTDRRTPPPRANVPGFLYPANAAVVGAAEIWTWLVDPAAPAPVAYPPFDPGDPARAAAAAFLESADFPPDSPLVILHTGAANPSYLWRDDRWVTVARALAADGNARFVLTGGPADAGSTERLAATIGAAAVSAAGKLSLRGACALVARADLVVSLDTALVHVAATMGTPVVGLYGPGDAAMWAPLGVPYRVITGETPCRECKTAACFQDRHYCMDAIGAEDVAAAAADLLAAKVRN